MAHNIERVINGLSDISCGFSLICLCINVVEDPDGLRMFSALFVFLLSIYSSCSSPSGEAKRPFLIYIFKWIHYSPVNQSQTCAKDVEHKKTCPVFHAGFCFTFPCIMHTKQMPFNALFPLFPLHLLLCPPPPDMFIYRGASCANRLFGRCTVNLRETGSNRSRTTKPLQSTPFFLLPGSF